MTASFSSSDKNIIKKQLNVDRVDLTLVDYHAVFEIDRCVQWILQSGLKRVALQFPDSLLHAAPTVCKLIQCSIPEEVFILGDTSFGECCVDEVAASHLNADGVVHFGHTCLTVAQKLPVLYIYTRQELDVDEFRTALCDQFSSSTNLLVIYDVQFDHCLRHFRVGEDRQGRLILAVPDEEHNDEQQADQNSFRKFGRRLTTGTWDELDERPVVFVSAKTDQDGGDEARLLNLFFAFAQPPRDIFIYEVVASNKGSGSLLPVSQSVARLLRRRNFAVEKARDAQRVGILVGTLGSRDYPRMLEQLRRTVRRAGKRSYTFLVGKPNVAKLANFPEIDVFVLVACPETSFPDTRDFLQPIITPYELEVACDPKRVLDGEYFTDFRSLLPGGAGHREPLPCGEEDAEEELDVSLITGRVRGGATEAARSAELAVITDGTVSVLHQGGGGQFLADRSWSGLEQNLGGTPVKPVGLGRTGLATGYSGEPGVAE